MKKGDYKFFGLVVVLSLFVFISIGSAATTISTNISTGGTLSVTGASTLTGDVSAVGALSVTGLSSLGQASSTMLSANTAYFGQTATSSFSSSGGLTLISTLSVAGLSSLAQASSTMFSANTAYFGQTATSTFNSAGALTLKGDLTLQNDETISNSTNGTVTIGATNLVLVGTASTSAIKVGNGASPSTISGLVFGYCTLGAATVTSASTTYASCTGASGVISGDRVFVQATSSLPEATVVTAASSTATAGTIQVRLHADMGATDIDADTVSLNFWAVR